jgi:AraC-like DNA-binding protein
LSRSRSFELYRIECAEQSRAPSEEEQEPAFVVSFPLAGLYVHHFGTKAYVAHPGAAIFMNRDDAHRTSHPAGNGDRNLELVLSDEAAEPYLSSETDGFRQRCTHVEPATLLKLRRAARWAARTSISPLELDEWAHAAITNIVGTSQWEDALSPRQRALVDAALEYLAWHFAYDADLGSVAVSVGSSPHHLSRLFHRGTGSTLSAYRTKLRINAAVDMVAAGASDLSAVACDVGFFDHAHMTRSFGRHLRIAPSEVRSALRDGTPLNATAMEPSSA